ncbi:MAG: ABC-F family ATP-binding cassette domain-containing protein [Chloroflexi bacterium]|nr:ABC-F family ATP-binding cassette domain-containing protein [Chloroflexota bacterium]
MAILTVSYLSQSFGAADIFSGVSASLPNNGRAGLVGPNGVGKTTLLRVLAGFSKPTGGSFHLAKGTRLGYLHQESARAFNGRAHAVYDEMLAVFADLRADAVRLSQIEAELAQGNLDDELFERYSALQERFELAGGYEYELRIKQTLTGLGFAEADWSLSLEHLSGGQKTRALLARLLLERPNLLILDEPTNHLDVEAIEWLEGALKTWSGAILLVSHDRYFLDKVVNAIWEMHPDGIERYRGNYTAYTQQRQERWQKKQQAYDNFRQHIDKEMNYIRRNIAGQRTQMAQGKLSRLAREVAAFHGGGLEALSILESKGWAQVTIQLACDMGRVATRVGELQQLINEMRGPSRPPTLKMRLPASHRSGHIVLRTKDLQIGYPSKLLFTAENIELHRKECAALIGGNGTGKTTFLRAILDDLEPLTGEIRPGASLSVGYFSQAHDDLDLKNSVLDELLRYENMNVSQARNYLARYLFRQDDVYKLVGDLSGGERGRLALAVLALQGANFLLLDEPTNHLDIPAQEALQAALEQFDGTILLVSHDRYLVNRLATQIWNLEDGRLRVHKGNYQQFLAQRNQEQEQAKEAAARFRAGAKAAAARKNGTGLSKNERRKRAEALAQLENDIAAAEADLATIGANLQAATQAQSFDKIQSLSVEYGAMESHLERLMTQWEKMTHE